MWENLTFKDKNNITITIVVDNYKNIIYLKLTKVK